MRDEGSGTTTQVRGTLRVFGVAEGLEAERWGVDEVGAAFILLDSSQNGGAMGSG